MHALLVIGSSPLLTTSKNRIHSMADGFVSGDSKQGRLHLVSCTVGIEGFDCRFKDVRWNPHTNRMEPAF